MPIYKNINKDFFKNWNREMAYILGFFAADGYITHNKRDAHFWSIQITDRELLCKIKTVIQAEHSISVRKSSNKNHKTLYRLQIGSKEMCEDLSKLGFRENKTKSLAVPNVPAKYFPDFVRGYFDGDGNVWIGSLNKKRKKKTFVILTAFTSCSRGFLEEIQKTLKKFNMIGGYLYKSKSYYRLQYSIVNSLKLYEFMYNSLESSGLFLDRKKRRFEEYIHNAAVV